MLRLLKRYNFGYHMSPKKNSEAVPGRSVIMSSYPGALSSQDESYVVSGKKEMVVAGTPLTINNRSLWSRLSSKEHVCYNIVQSAIRIFENYVQNETQIMFLI